MNDVIYLEPDDEITAVIDRVRISHLSFVVLVIPRGSSLAQSIVNLKILKRSAEELEKEIALVTGDRITRNLASQVGITVYSKVGEAERVRPIRQPKSEVKEFEGTRFRVNTYVRYKEETENETKDDRSIASESVEEPELEVVKQSAHTSAVGRELPPISRPAVPTISQSSIRKEPVIESKPVIKETKVNMQPLTKRRGRRSFKSPILAGSVLILLIATYLFLPYASASIRLKSEEYSQEVLVAIDRNGKAISNDGSTIPGNLIEVEAEKTKSFTATGKRDAGEKASGKIAVQNSYDSKVHKFAKGTKLTSGGKIFLADTDFSVAGAQTSLAGGKVEIVPGEGEVKVTAEKPGDSYNLAAATYVIEGAPSQIVGTGEKMAGGVTKEIKLIEEADIESAQSTLKAELTEEASKTLKEKAADAGLTLIESAISSELASVSTSKNAGDEAEKFDCTVKLKLFSTGFKDKELRSAVISQLNNQLGKDKMLVGPEKSDIAYQIAEGSGDVDNLKVNAQFKGMVADRIAESDLKALIRNKSAEKAQSSLAGYKNIESAELSVWPKAISRTPLLVNRINVKFDYAK